MLIFPFENVSSAPGLEWVAESFPEILGERMTSARLYVVSRDDRLNAFDQLGIPAGVKLSRATLYQATRQMDADYVVLGRYNFDGKTFQAAARVLNMNAEHLSPELSESGPLANLLEIENALSWDLLHTINPLIATSRNQFVSSSPAVRLDAFENYIRGVAATETPEKIKRFREAVRISPDYAPALLQLGKTYYSNRDYPNAVLWLGRIAKENPRALEANFYLGLGAYYSGDFATAERAFGFVASRLPLNEVYNNLGVVASRRGEKISAEYFRKAVQSDAQDPDFHFNLAVALLHANDINSAGAQLRQALALRPNDQEAKDLLAELEGAHAAPANLPLERIKRNYDQASFREQAIQDK